MQFQVSAIFSDVHYRSAKSVLTHNKSASKHTLIVVMTPLLLAGSLPAAVGAGDSTASKAPREFVAARSTTKVEPAAEKIEKEKEKEKEREASSATSDKQQNLQELTLNDLQDVGIQLRQIKQQAILIYEEASRTPVPLTASPEVPEIHTIPITHLPHAKLLPARQEWLVFFLATMEPVIRQMRKDVKDIEQGAATLVLPAASEKKLEPLWEGWTKNVQVMNSHLDQLVPLFDDAPHNNSKIQEVAVLIFDDVKKLEGIRKDVFRAVQLMERKTPDQKIFVGQ